MRVLMLGWEYPPQITGGLATASEGLTRALAALGVEIDFVLPRLTGREEARHMSIWACDELMTTSGDAAATGALKTRSEDRRSFLAETAFSPYARPGGQEVWSEAAPRWSRREAGSAVRQWVQDKEESVMWEGPLFREVRRYAREVARAAKTTSGGGGARRFDLVHAHDWMTFPAGIVAAEEARAPLVAHVHSLEFDRCGDGGGNPLIHAIERAGVGVADQVVAVSQYTRRMICSRLGTPFARVTVAHNGVRETPAPIGAGSGGSSDRATPSRARKRVLFLGRITYQKGPDIFVEAALEVLKHYREAVFVLAGDGDMLPGLRDRVHGLGLDDFFEFPGFLTGSRLEEEFASADLFVMPSVSEPFGIAPLEALSRGAPALISRQSGVSEVLSHVLKADFWDVRKTADFILNALLHPELGRTMLAMSAKEIHRLRWEATARNVLGAYRRALGHRQRGFAEAA